MIPIPLPEIDESRGREQIFCAIAQCAFAQIILSSSGNSPSQRKSVNDMITDSSSVTKALTQRQRNLTNMCHLFHRRTNERSQAFPFRLANDS